jgi:hypothetical protein
MNQLMPPEIAERSVQIRTPERRDKSICSVAPAETLGGVEAS